MPTIILILAIWVVLSIPMSVVLGFSFRSDTRIELVGMDGDAVVYRRANGDLERVSLVDRTAA
jgi:hypothetical protein